MRETRRSLGSGEERIYSQKNEEMMQQPCPDLFVRGNDSVQLGFEVEDDQRRTSLYGRFIVLSKFTVEFRDVGHFHGYPKA